MRLLILGGIGEALHLASTLAPRHEVLYSIAGHGRTPVLPCAVRVGGFGGVAGLVAFLQQQAIDLVIDATHPYAAHMSQHAVAATQALHLPLWAYRRPPWVADVGDDWRNVRDWARMQSALQIFKRPFFSIGLEPLRHVAAIPAHQHWLIRCLAAPPPSSARVTLICATGPFYLAQELELFTAQRIDVLVMKNSGGNAVEGKVLAARELKLPVIVLERPTLPKAQREFNDIAALSAALATAVEGWR